jgi:hypothetical protein
MEPSDLNSASRDALSQLLACDKQSGATWNGSDLHSILRHQLDTDVEFDLTHFGGVAKETLASQLTGRGQAEYGTFGQLLTAPDSPLEMLDLIRRFAKRSRTQTPGELPEEVATVLYYAAIAAARLRHGASLSKLDDEALQAGLEWGLKQTWLTEPLQDLFNDALEMIRSQISESDA